MTLDEKNGQLLFSSFDSVYVSSDGTTYDDLAALINQYHVGGFHIFEARVGETRCPPECSLFSDRARRTTQCGIVD
jgi:hypothetical protein